jgi:hypothetical protein
VVIVQKSLFVKVSQRQQCQKKRNAQAEVVGQSFWEQLAPDMETSSTNAFRELDRFKTL